MTYCQDHLNSVKRALAKVLSKKMLEKRTSYLHFKHVLFAPGMI